MVLLSKIFKECVQTKCCNDIVHSGPCLTNFGYQLHRFLISNMKSYSPIIALSVLTKLRSLDGNTVENILRYYLECVLAGWAVGSTVQAFICIFRHLFGGFRYYSFMFLPSLIGGLHIFWQTPRVQRLQTTSTFQGVLESLIIRRRNVITKLIANSVVVQTFLFMCSSTLILHAKQIGAYKGFWFLKPNRDMLLNEAVDTETTPTCSHMETSCNVYITKGIRSYLVFGMTLDLVKALMSNAPPSAVGFLKILFAKLRNFKIRSTALLAIYIGIYRFTHCYLNRKTNMDTIFNHNVASFLSGISYIFLPKLTLLSFSFVLSIQIVWDYLKRKSEQHFKGNIIWSQFSRIPIAKILYPFCLAHLIHVYCLQKRDVSNFAEMVINTTTDNYALHIFENISRSTKF